MKTINHNPQITTIIKKLTAPHTVDEIIEFINPSQILVKAGNYLQFIDVTNNFKEVQFDYLQNRWFEFKTTGKSDNPIETFINWID